MSMSLDLSRPAGPPEEAGASGAAGGPTRPARVLIVVPVAGDRLDGLEATVRSLQAQGEARGEDPPDVVLVAAASAGSVRALAQRCAATVVDDPGRGLAAAVNAGLHLAGPAHRYGAWLGAGECLLPGALRTTCAALDAAADAVLAFGDCRYEAPDGEYLYTAHTRSRARQLIAVGFRPPAQPAILYRLEAVTAAGGLDEQLHWAMDLDLLLRLRAKGRFVATGRTVAVVRRHGPAAPTSCGAAALGETRGVLARHLPGGLRPLTAAWPAPARWVTRRPSWQVQRGAPWLATRSDEPADPAPAS